ncbi:BTAD domain-containing putative transcriptional regulator [Streptomyces sp. NPDC102274]|uniref:AfsR/SARP family transcriptional regulator n=1 Tax=Streptomyces sp. NPDC102274 TaxID=3366151 RepID=UPI00380B62EA
MLFRILGHLRVEEEVEVRSPTRRAILTALLLRSGHPVGMTELAEMLWDDPPLSARANIRSHFTGLRRDLDQALPGLSHRIKTCRGTQSGYRIEVGPGEVDLPTFVQSSRQGRNYLARGEVERATAVLEDALALWRGPFGQDLPMTRWFDAHATGLRNGRLDTYEDLFTALLIAGRTEMLSYRIETIIAEAPYRQRLWELLAAVYCVQGDSAGALSVLRRCRTVLVEDLGLDVPPNVEAMRGAALTWDGDEALRLVAGAASCRAQTTGRGVGPGREEGRALPSMPAQASLPGVDRVKFPTVIGPPGISSADFPRRKRGLTPL